jgi:hypothetical protein
MLQLLRYFFRKKSKYFLKRYLKKNVKNLFSLPIDASTLSSFMDKDKKKIKFLLFYSIQNLRLQYFVNRYDKTLQILDICTYQELPFVLHNMKNEKK